MDKLYYILITYLCLQGKKVRGESTKGTVITPICLICKRTFKSARNLRDHVNEVHDKKTFKCRYPKCHKSFTRARTLQKHLQLHTDDKNHLCDYCGVGYNLKTSLIKHIRAQHNSRYVMPAESLVVAQPAKQQAEQPSKPLRSRQQSESQSQKEVEVVYLVRDNALQRLPVDPAKISMANSAIKQSKVAPAAYYSSLPRDVDINHLYVSGVN